MVFVGVLIGVAVLAGLAVWAFRRRGSDEMHSVAGYQHRLERLEELRQRQSGAVRIVGGSAPNAPQEPTLGEDGRLEISSSTSRRRAFDDDTNQVPAQSDRPMPTTYRRRRDPSIARMGHRPRRLGAPIAAAVAVIVLVTGLAIAGAHSRGGNGNTTTTTLAKKHHKNPPTTTTTTTTTPTTFAPGSTSGDDATYTLPFASYTVEIKGTTGDSYVEIEEAGGTVPYAQDLNAGATESQALSGNSEIIIGRPSDVSVEVDNTPVTFPTPLPPTLHLIFNSPGPSTTTTT
ncbi:MAG: RodZ domain-containing protein [Acidimicrobiales bacterium]